MKTNIFITGILLFALSLTGFGMEINHKGMDRDLVTEQWMKVPFTLEAGMGLESWMISPFSDAVRERELGVENWMTVPFEILNQEELTLENWMTEPFEVFESEGTLECWMVTPFEYVEMSAAL